MMLPNEGIIANDAKVLVKSEMLRQLWAVKRTTPDAWERATFGALTHGQAREDVDWEFEDNQAGYYTWIKAFDRLIEELIDDGYVKVVDSGGGERELQATQVDPGIEYSQVVHPSRRG